MNTFVIPLDHASPLPLYRQVVDRLIERIRSGALKPGDALPSVRALARDLLVSVITTVRAYDELEAGGWIVRRQGSGTFVADGVAQRAASEALADARSLLDEAVQRALDLGLTPDAVRAQVEVTLERS